MNRCIGCGIPLQTENKESLGYVKSFDHEYCERCYKAIHYHEFLNLENHISSKKIIQELNKQKGIVFFFIDFLSLTKENMEYYAKIKLPKICVISKSDIIPKMIREKRVEEYLKKRWKIKDKIVFINRYNFKFLSLFSGIPNTQKIFLVGPTNAGKTTFANGLLKSIGSHAKFTISEMPNTTLEWLELDAYGYHIYDTVGFPIEIPWEENIIKKANIKKPIRPKTYQIQENSSLNIENIIRISLNKKDSITWFGSDKLMVKKEYNKDIEGIAFSVGDNSNIYIKGLGFFYVKNGNTVIISGIEKKYIEVNPSMMGGNDEQY